MGLLEKISGSIPEPNIYYDCKNAINSDVVTGAWHYTNNMLLIYFQYSAYIFIKIAPWCYVVFKNPQIIDNLTIIGNFLNWLLY